MSYNVHGVVHGDMYFGKKNASIIKNRTFYVKMDGEGELKC